MENIYQQLSQKFEGDRTLLLVEQLIADRGWRLHRSHGAIAQYIRFLSVVALCQQATSHQNESVYLVPTAEVDRVWETDILRDTAAYLSLCDWLCGSTIHHMSEHAIRQAIKRNNLSITLSKNISNKLIDKAAGEISKNDIAEAAFHNTQALLTEQFGPDATDHDFLPAACGVLITPDRAIQNKTVPNQVLRSSS